MANDKGKSTYQDLLAGIDKLNKEETSKIYVISAGKSVPFKPLSVKQQKAILSSGVSTKLESLAFTNSVNEIILDCCEDKGMNILITDRNFILIQMRAASLGDNLKVSDDDGKDHEVDLKKHIDICLQKFGPESVKSEFIVDVDSVSIKCNVPTLQQDTSINKQFTKKAKQVNGDDKRMELTDVIGDLFVYEVIKYINHITIGEAEVDFTSGISIQQTLQVFESMPMKVSGAMTEKIKLMREVSDSVSETEQTPKDVDIPLDASLFAAN